MAKKKTTRKTDAEPKPEAKKAEPQPVVLGYEAQKVRKNLGCSDKAIEKVLQVQQDRELPTVMDAVRHILETA